MSRKKDSPDVEGHGGKKGMSRKKGVSRKKDSPDVEGHGGKKGVSHKKGDDPSIPLASAFPARRGTSSVPGGAGRGGAISRPIGPIWPPSASGCRVPLR